MSLKQTLKFIYTHPLNAQNKMGALFRFFQWQMSSRLQKGPYIFSWVNDARLIIEGGMTGATGNMYVGLMEYQEMSFLLHYLKQDHIFCDIGANIGVYTVLASKISKCISIAIEPLPNAFEKLMDNIQINRIAEKTILKNIGLSCERGKLNFTTHLDTMNKVSDFKTKDTMEVNVETLDNLSEKYGFPHLIKIDVEGFETHVLKGGMNTIRHENFEALIIELNGSGRKFGFDEKNIDRLLRNEGLSPYTYNPWTRKLNKLDTYGSHNTLYIRDRAMTRVQNQLIGAKKFHIKHLGITL